MSILDKLNCDEVWQEYYSYKLQKSHLCKRDEEFLTDFIQNKKYIATINKLKDNNFEFSLPTKKLINKSGSTKKRTIYKFPEDESMVLKLISYCLYDYDNKMSENCFSFRKQFGVKRAVGTIVGVKHIDRMYCYKLDISNYFNSINIDKLMPIVAEFLNDDPQLVEFFDRFLHVDKAVFEGEIINEKRGAMAGTSLSNFFANIYLRDLDLYFYERKIPYARYSDDIIVFAESKEKLEEYRQYINDIIKERELVVNPEKESFFDPHTAWNFLGIEYCDKVIDLSNVTINKLKAKIKRKAHALYRWKLKKSASTEKVIKVMIRVFNRKFYEDNHANELTWSRWFFPMITTSEGIKKIDNYLLQYLRFLSTGRHCKQNYNVRYNTLKELGFKSLVNEYYKFKDFENEKDKEV